MWVIKYGTWFISSYSIEDGYYGVNEIRKAKPFGTQLEAEDVVRKLKLFNCEIMYIRDWGVR